MIKYRWQVPSKKYNQLFRKKRFWFTLLLGLGVIGYYFAPIILSAAGNYLVLNTFHDGASFSKSRDFAIVLSGEFPDRLMESAMLYREGKIDQIVVTRETESSGYQTLTKWGVDFENQQQRSISLLMKLGVPEKKIIALKKIASSTGEEAKSFLQWWNYQQALNPLAPNQSRSLLVITSPSHSRRANYIFTEILGERWKIYSKASRYDPFPNTPWWRERYYWRQVLMEYEKLLTRSLAN
jgi:uncharacterized SAM-binding protein YcdF (DUF218 family)